MLILGNCEYVSMKKGLYLCVLIKDIEMGRQLGGSAGPSHAAGILGEFHDIPIATCPLDLFSKKPGLFGKAQCKQGTLEEGAGELVREEEQTKCR